MTVQLEYEELETAVFEYCASRGLNALEVTVNVYDEEDVEIDGGHCTVFVMLQDDNREPELEQVDESNIQA